MLPFSSLLFVTFDIYSLVPIWRHTREWHKPRTRRADCETQQISLHALNLVCRHHIAGYHAHDSASESLDDTILYAVAAAAVRTSWTVSPTRG